MSSLPSSDPGQKKPQKRKRGRPRKVLTSEEFLALQNKPQRGRGRPKKQLTEEEKQAKILSKQRGKGRPKKEMTPQEEWVARHAPKKTKGRPKKDEILGIALPRIFEGSGQDIVKQALMIEDSYEKNPEPHGVQGKKNNSRSVADDIAFSMEVDRVIRKIKSREKDKKDQIVEEKEMPKLPWDEFKQKMNLTDYFVEDYVFPFSEAELKQEAIKIEETLTHQDSTDADVSHGKEKENIASVSKKQAKNNKARMQVFAYDEPSSYVLDLRDVIKEKELKKQAKQADKEYAWEKGEETKEEIKTRQKAEFLQFSSPIVEEEGDEKIVYSKPKKEKVKTAKINLVQDDNQLDIEMASQVHHESLGVGSKKNKVKENKIQKKKIIKKNSKEKAGLGDKFLVAFGKGLYKVWEVIVAPFKLVNFILDSALFALISFLKMIGRGIVGMFRTNVAFVEGNLKQTEAVKVVTEDVSRRRSKKKPAYAFAVICLLVLVPILTVSFVNKIKQTKGNVLGVSSDGINYLKEAGSAMTANNTSSVLKNFSDARQSFGQAETELESLGVLAGFFSKMVPEADSGKKMIEAGNLVSEIGEELARGMALFNGEASFDQGSCASLPGAEAECFGIDDLNLTDKLAYIQNIFANQSANINRVIDIVEAVDEDSLPLEYQEQIVDFKNNVQNLRLIVEKLNNFFDFGLEFLGADEAKRYLIVFQNTAEARATGGFMGSFALVDMYQGNVRKMEIPGGGFYDLKASNQTMVEAPKPLQISSPLWNVWNANWFPNFPTSADKVIWFYENLADSSSVDGVITLTQDVVVDMLGFTGEIAMDDYEKTFDQDNFVDELQKSVEIEYDTEENKPKKIIAEMTPVLLDRIFDLDQETFLQFLISLSGSIEKEKVLFYFKDDVMQDLIEDMDWSGEMQDVIEGQDYLSVVHTNISGGKTDNVIKNKIRHSVEVQADGSLVVTVTLTRDHQGDLDKVFENENNVDYVRFYAPQGSEFISAEGFNFKPSYLFDFDVDAANIEPDPHLTEVEQNIKLDEASNTRISEEFGKVAFGNWVQVAPGDTQTVSVTYKLPFKLSETKAKTGIGKWFSWFKQQENGDKYVLIVDKQLGRGAEDFVSTFKLRDDRQILENITGNGKLEKSGNEVNFVSSLEKDAFYGVVFE